jgi:hypothetical protein
MTARPVGHPVTAGNQAQSMALMVFSRRLTQLGADLKWIAAQFFPR